ADPLDDVDAVLVLVVVRHVGGERAGLGRQVRVPGPPGRLAHHALTEVLGHLVGDALALHRHGPHVGVEVGVEALGEVRGPARQGPAPLRGALGGRPADRSGAGAGDGERAELVGDDAGVEAGGLPALALRLVGRAAEAALVADPADRPAVEL